MKKRKSLGCATGVLPAYVLQLPERGGRAVLAAAIFDRRLCGVLTAAHCVNFGTNGEMVLGDYYLEKVQAGNTGLTLTPFAVEPVSDIALLGAPDEQVFPDEVEAFEEFCANTQPVPLFTGFIKPRKPMPVRILGHDRRWIDGSVGLFYEHSSSLWIEGEREILGGNSGGPVLTLDGELVAIVSNASIPQGGSKATGCCPRPLFALPVWACLKYFGAAITPRRIRRQ